MVGAGQPEGAIALHTLEARDCILQSVVEGVPHMQLTGYVGGRHHYGEWHFVFVYLRSEIAVLLPVLIKSVLKIVRVVYLFHKKVPLILAVISLPMVCAYTLSK